MTTEDREAEVLAFLESHGKYEFTPTLCPFGGTHVTGAVYGKPSMGSEEYGYLRVYCTKKTCGYRQRSIPRGIQDQLRAHMIVWEAHLNALRNPSKGRQEKLASLRYFSDSSQVLFEGLKRGTNRISRPAPSTVDQTLADNNAVVGEQCSPVVRDLTKRSSQSTTAALVPTKQPLSREKPTPSSTLSKGSDLASDDQGTQQSSPLRRLENKRRVEFTTSESSNKHVKWCNDNVAPSDLFGQTPFTPEEESQGSTPTKALPTADGPTGSRSKIRKNAALRLCATPEGLNQLIAGSFTG